MIYVLSASKLLSGYQTSMQSVIDPFQGLHGCLVNPMKCGNKTVVLCRRVIPSDQQAVGLLPTDDSS